jgi:hypothetical protein
MMMVLLQVYRLLSSFSLALMPPGQLCLSHLLS